MSEGANSFGPAVSDAAREGWSGRRVLVTGGLGFVGSSVAIALVEAGAEVRLLDALLPLYGGNRFNIEPVSDRVSVVVADVRQETVVRDALEGCDAVIHIAAQTSHVDSMIDPLLDADINVRGTLILLRSVADVCPGATVLYLGTRAQYGAIERESVDESGPFRPTDFYGVSKHAAEMYGLVWHRTLGLDVRGLRATNAFGPRHQMKHGRYGILNWFVRLALSGERLTVFGEGSQIRDFLFVDDLVDAMLLAAGPRGEPGDVFNVGTGRGLAFREMARAIADAVGGVEVVHVPWPDDRERIETGDFRCDAGALAARTGWAPRTTFEDGLARTVDFYRAHREHYW